ncbi:MAG: hypothetical protein JXA73_25240 [Acidobacteria bacterium]|nr:hypothetical protein [Acidobacteriota bacterium]
MVQIECLFLQLFLIRFIHEASAAAADPGMSAALRSVGFAVPWSLYILEAAATLRARETVSKLDSNRHALNHVGRGFSRDTLVQTEDQAQISLTHGFIARRG